jgi:N-acetyl-gamma-glutamyl-phosphate reductase
MQSINAAIVGGTGYTGAELLRLLSQHPQVNIMSISSRSEAGNPVADLFGSLRGQIDLSFTDPSELDPSNVDVVFYATPNGIAMQQVPELLEKGVKVIDLAADFRLQDINVWEKWYGQQHACPEVVATAAYGLPELNRETIKSAQLIANPGCYATAIQLALYPLLKANLLAPEDIIADGKSGVSGAGRGAAVGSLYSEVAESFKAYKVEGHRHQPEICESLENATGIRPQLIFTPHLLPMIRGIECTIYAKPKADIQTLQQALENAYQDEPFITVLPLGSVPDTASVRGSNNVHISLAQQGQISNMPNRVILMAVEDNLVKGAAGQAVQNMNLAFGFEETMGLNQLGLMP